MTETVEEDCPVCSATDGTRERFAVAKVAEHIKQKARHDTDHQAWIDEQTEDGSLSEIRDALADHSRPRS